MRNPHPFVPGGAEARWNSAGVRVAYTSEHPALAALELLVHWNAYPALLGYRLFSATIDDGDVEARPGGVDPLDARATRAHGDAWVAARRTLALAVPSVVAPLSTNYVVNPAHPRFAGFSYEDHGPFVFDERILDLVTSARGG